MEAKNTYPVGLKLPLVKGNNGYFDQNFNTLDQVYTNMKNLLLTSVGERRLNVTFGSKLKYFLFEPTENNLSESISNYITGELNSYFPYVNVLEVSSDFPKETPNLALVKIIFELKNSSSFLSVSEFTKTLIISIPI